MGERGRIIRDAGEVPTAMPSSIAVRMNANHFSRHPSSP